MVGLTLKRHQRDFVRTAFALCAGAYTCRWNFHVCHPLVGDEEAVRNITFVEIPSLEGGYSTFYNPSGSGSEPFEDVRYTTSSQPDLEPMINALDDPMRVDRAAP